MPKRVRRKNWKKWQMPEGTKYVGRPTVWGNPYKVEKEENLFGENYWVVKRGGIAYLPYHDDPFSAKLHCIALYRKYAENLSFEKLRGYDLACWCKLDEPCHADVILEILYGVVEKDGHQLGLWE